MRKQFLALVFVCLLIRASSQPAVPAQRLKVFIDCINAHCDMDYIRTEINIVDFLLDRQAADVHILITEQETGGGGREVQFIFFGQNQLKQMAADTIRFSTGANATDFERREFFIKYLKLGLTPYILKTGQAKDIVIEMKKKGDDSARSAITKDPWNYWVFRIGVDGHFDADEVYKSSRWSGDLSANRVTDKIKIGFEADAGKNQDSYELEDSSGAKEKIVNKNEDYELSHYLVKSLTGHWSYGYEVAFSRSTFSNNKGRALFRTGFEYDIFPYKEVNTKLFTISYLVDVQQKAYFDTTLYDKTKEVLFGHGLEAKLRINQKWGTVFFGTEYHNYLHNWKYLNLEVNAEVDIRITGNLTFNIYTSAALIRDQLYLPKEGATSQEVLTRRRQLASGYRIFTYFGLNYRFGSKLNNFVNPRFD